LVAARAGWADFGHVAIPIKTLAARVGPIEIPHFTRSH
jgi:hypothetical protein